MSVSAHLVGNGVVRCGGTDGERVVLQSGEGSLQATYDTDGKIVFVSSKADRAGKMWKNDKPEDAMDKYEDEEPVSRPNGTERAEVEEIMAKKQRGEVRAAHQDIRWFPKSDHRKFTTNGLACEPTRATGRPCGT